MMENQDRFFTPEHVDEQIDQYLGKAQMTSETWLLAETQRVARQMSTEQEAALRRVEQRLLARHLTRGERPSVFPVKSAQQQPLYPQKIPQGSFHPMKNTPSSDTGVAKFGRRVSLLVAVLVMTVLVGSLVMVLNLTHRSTSTASGPRATSTPTTIPTEQPSVSATPPGLMHEGTVVYTSPASSDYYAVAWSPDSQRLATSTNDQVQIWDATTGEHPSTFSVGGALSLAWSPNGQYLAVASRQVQIIDPKTGIIVRSFPSQVASVNASTNPYFSASFPFSGGYGVSATAWSPDGSLMATALTSATYGNVVMVWNPGNGQLVYTFRGQSSNEVSSVSWSADGKYIASAGYDGTVKVWNARTGQVIFQRQTPGAPYAAWAPSGMLLAFISNSPTIQVWNIATNKEIASYNISQPGALAWSPDGKEIASTSGNNVAILDIATAKTVYLFTKQGGTYARTLAWSPDGKYIASASGDEGGGNHVTVWIA